MSKHGILKYRCHLCISARHLSFGLRVSFGLGYFGIRHLPKLCHCYGHSLFPSKTSQTSSRPGPLPRVDVLLLSTPATAHQRPVENHVERGHPAGLRRPALGSHGFCVYARARPPTGLSADTSSASRPALASDQETVFISNQAVTSAVCQSVAGKAHHQTTSGSNDVSFLTGGSRLRPKPDKRKVGSSGNRLPAQEPGTTRFV